MITWLGQTPRMTHVQARAQVVRSFRKELGRDPSMREAQFEQAMALCETGYGSAWDKVCGGAGVGSNNMGAIQKPGGPPCGPGAFECVDTHEDGTPYSACFRSYPSPEEGFDHLTRVLYKYRPKVLAATEMSIRDFSTTLRASGYFELGLEKHIKAITRCLESVTGALNEPMPPLVRFRPRSSLSKAAIIGAGAVAGYFVAIRWLV